MVLDSSVMNVSISQIVADLDTTITGRAGRDHGVHARDGGVHARRREARRHLGPRPIFAIGLAVYGLGSLTTALSPNLSVLLFGWSLVEGLGAVLVIPAIVALIAANYEGKERAFAFGIIGGVAGAAIAAGPLIGGWVTTELQLALRLRRRGRDRDRDPARPPEDAAGAARRDRPQLDSRRRGALGARPRARRVRDPPEQHRGAGSSRIARRRSAARVHAVRLLARAVPHLRRVVLLALLQPLGGASRAARPGRAARPRARCGSRRCAPASRRC